MALTKEFMISEIKKHNDKYGVPYSRCRISGGETTLEQAPEKNIYGMYVAVCLTGKRAQKQSTIVRL
jgi:hypothetical protein